MTKSVKIDVSELEKYDDAFDIPEKSLFKKMYNEAANAGYRSLLESIKEGDWRAYLSDDGKGGFEVNLSTDGLSVEVDLETVLMETHIVDDDEVPKLVELLRRVADKLDSK